MKSVCRFRVALSLFTGMLVTAAVAPWAWAQTPAGPGSPPSALPGAGPVPTPPELGGHGWLAVLVLMIGLIVIIGAAAKIVDLRNRRETEALQLQAQVGDALLQDQALGSLPVVPTAHVPLTGSPATVEVSGQVPNPELREAALHIAEREASRVRPDVRIEDKLEVAPSTERRAA